MNNIEIKNLLSLLELRVPTKFFETPPRDIDKYSMFHESIVVLKSLVDICESIESNKLLSQEEFIQQQHQTNIAQNIQFLFEGLRFYELMFDFSCLELHYIFQIYKDFVLGWQHSSQLPHSQKFILSEKDFQSMSTNERKRQLVWETETPIDLCFALIEHLKNALGDSQNNQNLISTQAVDQQVQLDQFFLKLLQKYESVYTVVLDIQLPQEMEIRSRANYFTFIESRLDSISKIQQEISTFPTLLNAFHKLEQDYELGLNLHCILIFENRDKISSEAIIKKLDKLIFKKIPKNHEYIIKDWSERLRENSSIGDVTGVITSFDINSKVEGFKKWVLGYYCWIDTVVQLKFNDSRKNLAINNQFITISSANERYCYSSEYLPSSCMTFDKLSKEFDNQKNWKISHLSHEAQNRLTISSIFYDELFNKFPFFVKYEKLLKQVEIFVATTIDSQLYIFDLSVHKGSHILLYDHIKDSLTRIGKLFFTLMNHLKELLEIKHRLPLDRLSLYGKYFFTSHILENSCFLINLKIDEERAIIFNNALQEFRKIYFADIKRTQESSQIWTKNPFSKGFQLRRNQPAFIDFFNLLNGDIVIQTNQVVSLLYKKCMYRQNTLNSYMQNIFKKDCLFYRLNFQMNTPQGALPQQYFSKLLTSFLHRYRNSTPLSWNIGYFGLWRQKEDKVVYADIVLIFDVSKYHLLETVEISLNELWKKFIQNELNPNIELLPLLSFVPDLNQKYLLHEVGNHKSRKLVSSFLIPYFSYLEMYDPLFDYPVKKLLIKASLPKAVKEK